MSVATETFYGVTADHLGWRNIRQAIKDDTESDARTLAQSIVALLSESQVREFAVQYATDVIEHLRRIYAREIEAAAERPVYTPSVSHNAVFEQYRDDPIIGMISNNRDRYKFRRWMGDAFNDWYRTSRARIAELASDKLERFEEDWDPDGVQAHLRKQLSVRLIGLANDAAARIRLEVTNELLVTMFALGDGARVTWGEATVEQHEQRIGLLLGNAAGNVETAARHQAAIALIQARGVTCLAEARS